jgi:hypothetical protein
MGVKVGAALVGLVLVASAAAATPHGKAQRFTSLLKSDKEAAPGINGATSTSVYVAPDANYSLFFVNALTDAAKAKLDAVRFEHTFLIGVLLGRRTSGYSVTIKRITLQRVSRSRRQFCVTASVKKPAPGVAVVSQPWFTAHIVALSADPYRIDEFHWAIPKDWVLRDASGRLLAVSYNATNRQGKRVATGKAKLCHA